MIGVEQLREQVFSDDYKKEEWQREQYSGYRNPRHSKTDQQVNELEDRE